MCIKDGVIKLKIFKELTIILTVYFIGELINKFFLPIVPGTIIGMVLLLIFLLTGILKVNKIDTTSDYLLKNLSFFFIPAAVGLITVLDVVKDNVIPILIIIIVSTIVVVITTGLTVQFLKRMMKK
ncbi:MAG: LrgA family protein [Haloplasmataceae bacterium]|jgi:holin-like protein|nr:LrgA family protein [Haloplasmataceae bacterium]